MFDEVTNTQALGDLTLSNRAGKVEVTPPRSATADISYLVASEVIFIDLQCSFYIFERFKHIFVMSAP